MVTEFYIQRGHLSHNRLIDAYTFGPIELRMSAAGQLPYEQWTNRITNACKGNLIDQQKTNTSEMQLAETALWQSAPLSYLVLWKSVVFVYILLVNAVLNESSKRCGCQIFHNTRDVMMVLKRDKVFLNLITQKKIQIILKCA